MGDGSPGERMGRVATGIPVLSHPPVIPAAALAQADHSLPNGSSMRGNKSPDLRKVYALAFWCLSLTSESQ